MAITSFWTWALKMCVEQIGPLLAIFVVFLKFWHKYYKCIQSSGNEDSYATFHKFLGCPSTVSVNIFMTTLTSECVIH